MRSKTNETTDRTNEYSATPAAMVKVLAEWDLFKKEEVNRYHAKRQEFAERYGILVKLLRARRRISQKELAGMIGISEGVIGKIETGYLLPSDRIHNMLIDFFRMTPEYRFGRTNLAEP